MKVLAVAFVVLAVGAVSFSLVRALRGQGGGADKPEDAVQHLADAANNNDVLGLITAVDPHEVTSLGEVWTKTEAKAQAIGLAETAPGKHSKFTIENLDLQATMINDDLAKVKVRSGKVTASYESDGTLAVGGELPKGNDKASYNLKDMDSDYRFVMVVKRDGRWYVSVLYTLAEDLKIALDGYSGSDLDDLGFGPGHSLSKPNYANRTKNPEKAGADSPSAAVTGLVNSVNDTDPDKILNYLSPNQFGAAYDYFDTFVTDGLRKSFSNSQKDYKWSVDDLKLSEEDMDGDRKKVTIQQGTLSWKSSSSSSASEERVEINDTCYTYVRGGKEDQSHCLEDWTALKTAFPSKLFLVVRQENGKWFVDPVDTVCQYAITLMEHIDDNEARGILAGFTVGKPTHIDVGSAVTADLADGMVGALYSFDAKAGHFYAARASDSSDRINMYLHGDGLSSSGYGHGGALVYARDDGPVVVNLYRSTDAKTFNEPSKLSLTMEEVDASKLPEIATGDSEAASLTDADAVALYRFAPDTDASYTIKTADSSSSYYSNAQVLDATGSSAYGDIKAGSTYVVLVYGDGHKPLGDVTVSLDPKPGYLPSGDSSPRRLEAGKLLDETLTSSSSSSSSSGVRNFYLVGDGKQWRVGVTSASFSVSLYAYAGSSSSSIDSDYGTPSSSSPVVVTFNTVKGKVYVVSVSGSYSGRSFQIGADSG